MPVRLVCTRHVLPCQSSTHNSVVMVLYSPAAEPDVIETSSISSLHRNKKEHLHLNPKYYLLWLNQMKNKMCPGTLTYHPNISSGLQLCIDPVAPEVRVHLQTCGLGKVNIGLEANSCNYVIRFHLQEWVQWMSNKWNSMKALLGH